mmetsp:Transcript_15571/g.49228  ORF Transcript_15571/g.49228 Transcript_15571/m.49228 type:complete len:205 (+) Transcript_15571:911-1525(+)
MSSGAMPGIGAGRTALAKADCPLSRHLRSTPKREFSMLPGLPAYDRRQHRSRPHRSRSYRSQTLLLGSLASSMSGPRRAGSCTASMSSSATSRPAARSTFAPASSGTSAGWSTSSCRRLCGITTSSRPHLLWTSRGWRGRQNAVGSRTSTLLPSSRGQAKHKLWPWHVRAAARRWLVTALSCIGCTSTSRYLCSSLPNRPRRTS